MIGTAVVALPWAYQSAGILVGLLITLMSMLVSYYTCYIIYRTAGDDKDYSETLFKYYGLFGWIVGLVGPMCLIIGAVSVYFVVDT